MSRTLCCICKHYLHKINTVKNAASRMGMIENIEDTSIIDIDVGVCTQCMTVQSMTLIDLDFLYQHA